VLLLHPHSTKQQATGKNAECHLQDLAL